MCFLEEQYCKVTLQHNGVKFNSADVKRHFNTLLTPRDSCHDCRNPLNSALKL